MRILFLDDMSARWTTFFERVKAPGITVDWVKTAEEAIAKLNEPLEEEYRHVFLDHDLAPEHYSGQTSSEPTGEEVVKFIVQQAHHFRGTSFWVHSLNIPASIRMTELLVDAGLDVKRVPGAWMTVRLTEV